MHNESFRAIDTKKYQFYFFFNIIHVFMYLLLNQFKYGKCDEGTLFTISIA